MGIQVKEKLRSCMDAMPTSSHVTVDAYMTARQYSSISVSSLVTEELQQRKNITLRISKTLTEEFSMHTAEAKATLPKKEHCHLKV